MEEGGWGSGGRGSALARSLLVRIMGSLWQVSREEKVLLG